jgi:hypothetical protein
VEIQQIFLNTNCKRGIFHLEFMICFQFFLSKDISTSVVLENLIVHDRNKRFFALVLILLCSRFLDKLIFTLGMYPKYNHSYIVDHEFQVKNSPFAVSIEKYLLYFHQLLCWEFVHNLVSMEMLVIRSLLVTFNGSQFYKRSTNLVLFSISLCDRTDQSLENLPVYCVIYHQWYTVCRPSAGCRMCYICNRHLI